MKLFAILLIRVINRLKKYLMDDIKQSYRMKKIRFKPMNSSD